MSNKDLQRLTKCVSYMGQPVSPTRALSNHPSHIAQKINITSLLSAEFYCQPKGSECSSEMIGLYTVIARLMSLSLQYGASLEKVGDRLAGAQFVPWSPVIGHDRTKYCSSFPDPHGRHLLTEHCVRHEWAHVPLSKNAEETPR